MVGLFNLFGIGRALLFFFRSSVWLLPLPRHPPPPSGELASLLCFLFYEFTHFSFWLFFILLIWYNITRFPFGG